MIREDSSKILEEFLSYPISGTEEIFRRFEGLPGAIAGRGSDPMERYVCIPGTREDGIVLVAHADTVWDAAYGDGGENALSFENGYYKSGNGTCGIGADDHAGCAMLWLLRDSGHTLLLVNGEEKGKRGAKFLRSSNPELFARLNRHCFMLELDSYDTGRCNFNQVDNTRRFKKYITRQLGFRDDTQSGGCDLQVLCEKICGVNIGIGYHYHHTYAEYLSLAEWENTLSCVEKVLQRSHCRFRTSVPKKLQHTFAASVNFAAKALKKLLHIRSE